MKYKIMKKKIDNKIEYFVNEQKIDRFELLALALNQESKKEAWEVMNIASQLYHIQDDDVFNTLYGAVAMDITRRWNVNEYTIQYEFKKNIDKIFDKKAKIIEKKNNSKHIPDVWIEMEKEEIPVEVKLNEFDAKALKQLKRYMNFYKCRKGIAVGTKYTANKEKNVIFIPIDSFYKK